MKYNISYNLSKVDGEILYKKKIFFKVVFHVTDEKSTTRSSTFVFARTSQIQKSFHANAIKFAERKIKAKYLYLAK